MSCFEKRLSSMVWPSGPACSNIFLPRVGAAADIAGLTRAVPNLSISTQGGPGNQIIELRGISSTAGPSTVSVYLDDNRGYTLVPRTIGLSAFVQL